MSKPVDVVAVLRHVVQWAFNVRACGGNRGAAESARDKEDAAIDAVAELIAADVALDDLLQMPAQPECIADFSAMVAAAKRRRAAALAACKPTGAEK